jgi:hypothetical protein
MGLHRLFSGRSHSYIGWRRDYGASGQGPRDLNSFHWRRHRSSLGLGRDRKSLGVNQNGARGLHRHRTSRRVTKGGLRSWCNFGTGHHLNMSQLLRVDTNGCLRSIAAGGEVRLPDHGHVGAVDVGDVCDVGDIHVRVLYVDIAALLNVGDIHAVDIARAAAIPGMICLAWPEREPRRHTSAAN